MVRRIAAFVFAAALAAGASGVSAASPEAELRTQLERALWPAEIVQLAADYRRSYPRSSWRAAADELGTRAAGPARVLERKDVRLFRSAFSTESAPTLADEVRRAALGDTRAATRIAHAHRRGTDGITADVNRYVGWLQYAAMLGDEEASYELAVHFRRESQIPLASLYEARAVELGYVLPRDLDHVRK